MKVKLKYRNTGFMRQVFVWFKWKNQWRFKGVEFNCRYFRIYKLAQEGVSPRFRDLWGGTKNRRKA